MLDITVSIALFISIAYLFIFKALPRSYNEQLKRLNLPVDSDPIAFFHPTCNQGGGGERVLWMAIQALQRKSPEKYIVIYTMSSAKTSTIPEIVKQQFGVELLVDKIVFARLNTWKYLESSRYPRLTLIMSSLGSLIPAFEAIHILRPKVMVESVGFAFIYPLFKLFGSKVVAYVHYPTISSDMLRRVEERTTAFNNNSTVANSSTLSYLKLQYYRSFSHIYGFVGSFCDSVMVNSSWTRNHINDIWKLPLKTRIVYPPCDTKRMLDFKLNENCRSRTILSVSQFRPEKNHSLQVGIMEQLFRRHPEWKTGPLAVKLILVGSVRNAEDKARVSKLKEQILSSNLEV